MKLALVTGTSRGIGAAIARSFIAQSWQVRGLARGPAPADLEASSDYVHDQVDLNDLSAVESWFEQRAPAHELANCERVALVNNAGMLEPMRPLRRVEIAEFDRALRVNVTAPTWLMGALVARRSIGTVRIVNLSSGAATSAYPGWAAYCASKAALKMAGQVMAREHEEQGTGALDLAVIDYAPHVVATAMQESIRATKPEDFPLRRKFLDLHEFKELVEPEGPANEVVELCSADNLKPWTERRFQP